KDALVLARRLVETSGGGLVDLQSGAYNLNFLHELLEKEISRAGRHHHELSLVFFRAENYAQLLDLGGGAAEAALAQMVDLMRNRTRKVNSLARVSDTDFCLVVPEAGREVAEKIAHDLGTAAESESFDVGVNGGRDRIKIKLSTRTVSNPRAADAVAVAMPAMGLVPN
ncbi:MAG: diguanylate cyclase domain-containing protein, partial [Candidatus Dormibacteria bacterium]